MLFRCLTEDYSVVRLDEVRLPLNTGEKEGHGRLKRSRCTTKLKTHSNKSV